MSKKQLTVEDVRMFLNDFPETNKLDKGNVEFSADRIKKAVEFVIEDWNATPPRLTTYSEETFPYRSLLLYGVCAWLYQGQAMYQERIRLTYQSGGLSITDDDRAQSYLNFANFLQQKYEKERDNRKDGERLNEGWAIIGSEYRDLDSRY